MADIEQELLPGTHGLADSLNHAIESLGQVPEFISPLFRNTMFEVACADPADSFGQPPHRF